MNVLSSLTIRYLTGRKLRTALTTLAVVFGVAVIFGVNVLLPTFVSAIESAVLGVSGQADLTVSSRAGESFSVDVAADVKNVEGVAEVSPALRRQVSFGELPMTEGEVLRVEFVGVDPATAPLVRRQQLTSGRLLEPGDAQVAVLTDGLAWVLGLRVGDTLRAPTPSGLVDLQVVGIVSGSEEQVIVPLTFAQGLFDQLGRANSLDLALAAGSSKDAVKADLERALGPDFRVGSAALASDAFSTIEAGLVGINVVGILTLFMGGFLIFNTYRTSVIERQHDVGVLRSVGATRRTVLGLILAESVAQGVVGTAIGLVVGYLFASAGVSALQGLLDEYLRVRVTGLVLTPTALLLAIALGIGVTVVAGLLPALSASRVSVITALKPQATAAIAERRGISRGGVVGLVLVGLSVACLVSGNAALAGLGAFLFLGGLVSLAPTLVRPVARLVAPVLQLAFAGEGRLAEGNTRRQPGRSAITASAVMIALAIVIAAGSIFASIQSAFRAYIEEGYAAEFILLPPSLGLWGSDIGLNPEFEAKLANVEGIGDWASIRYAAGQIDDQTVQVLAFDPVAFPKVAGLTFDEGEASAYRSLTEGRNAIANPILATAAGLKVGDEVEVGTPDGPRAYRIVAIANDYLAAKLNTLYVSQASLAADWHKTEAVIVMANSAPGADARQVEAGIAELLEGYPQVSLYSGEAWRAEQTATLDKMGVGLYVVLVVLAIPSLLGLVNTLAIGVLERTREIGVLRAVGATQSQVRRLVLAESLLLSALGMLLGLAGGLALGQGLTALLSSTMTRTIAYSFPAVAVVVSVVAAGAMALIASLLPARQAARLRIVRALMYE